MEIVIGALISIAVALFSLYKGRQIRQSQHEELVTTIDGRLQNYVGVHSDSSSSEDSYDELETQEDDQESHLESKKQDAPSGLIPTVASRLRSKVEMESYGQKVTSNREKIVYVKYQSGTPENPENVELPVKWSPRGREIWKAVHGIISRRQAAGLKPTEIHPDEMLTLQWRHENESRTTTSDFRPSYISIIVALIHRDGNELSEILAETAAKLDSDRFSIRWQYGDQTVTFSRNANAEF